MDFRRLIKLWRYILGEYIRIGQRFSLKINRKDLNRTLPDYMRINGEISQISPQTTATDLIK